MDASVEEKSAEMPGLTKHQVAALDLFLEAAMYLSLVIPENMDNVIMHRVANRTKTNDP